MCGRERSVLHDQAGYTVCLIGGYDREHTIDHVGFESFRIGDRKVLNPDDLDLYMKHATDITFG